MSNAEKHLEHLLKGTFLMVCSGESYFTSFVTGPDIVKQMMSAMCGENEADWEPGEKDFWTEHISDPDNWIDDQDHGPTRFKMDVGETDHIELFLITHDIFGDINRRCREACGASEPSAGHDWVDEVCGLLRVTRLQRDECNH